jgi:hypothetical protein
MSGEIERLISEAPKVVGALGGIGVARYLFGASLEEVGEAMRRVTAWQLRNIGRTVEAADRKTAGQDEAASPAPRASLAILAEASNAEDAVMADYLGGVLASARESGDDDAVTWTAMIGRMSSSELRLHYRLYAALQREALGMRVNPGIDAGRNDLRFFVHSCTKATACWRCLSLPTLTGLTQRGSLRGSFPT